MKNSLIAFCLAALALTVSAKADTIGPVCASCYGNTYTLNYSTTGSPNVFDIFLTINATGYNQSSTDTLKAVSLKVTDQTSNIVAVSLISPPTPASFGAPILGGLDAGGCSGNGGGYFCTSSSNNGLQLAHPGDIYTFEFQLTLGSASELFTTDQLSSIKALFLNSDGEQVGITSEDVRDSRRTPTVPEPSSLVLLGTGLASLAGLAKKKILR